MRGSSSEINAGPGRLRRKLAVPAAALLGVLPGCAERGTPPVVTDTTATTTTTTRTDINVPISVPRKGGPEVAPKETESTVIPVEPGYIYAGAYQWTRASGISVNVSQNRPELSPEDSHTLMEIAVFGDKGKDIVEFGWTVDKGTNGDDQPRLFGFRWTDGVSSCYNFCGFVATSESVKLGDPVEVGETGLYSVRHQDQSWQLWYGDDQVGYYPDDLWGGEFTGMDNFALFGEVHSNDPNPCSDMGSGARTYEPGVAFFKDLSLIGTSDLPKLEQNFTGMRPELYGSVLVGGSTVLVGGPGAC